MKRKVLIIEDEAVTANILKGFLQQHHYDAYVATCPELARTLLGRHRFDVVISDINLGKGINGIDFVKQLIKGIIPVVFLTSYSDSKTLKKAELSQPYAYLTKPFNDDQLLLTLNMAIVNSKKRFIHYQNNTINKHRVELTNREIEIVRLIAQGDTTDKIANTLHISPQTVGTHRKNIMYKTNANNVIELVSLAVEMNWI